MRKSSLRVLLRCALFVAVVVVARAQETSTLQIRVAETAGIRRGTYPTSTRIKFPRGRLPDARQTVLLLDGKPVQAQFGAESSYSDGSVEWLTLDFNPSVGPREEATYTLEYGPNARRGPASRGLEVSRVQDAIQIGNVQLGLDGFPLVTSLNIRQQDIGQGPNGFSVVDTTGTAHNVGGKESKVDIRKTGPLAVLVRYSGQIMIGGSSTVGYGTRVEIPNSKSWVKATTLVADPDRRIREIAFSVPLALGAQPWQWDFGTGSWTYGLLRNPTDVVTLTQSVGTAQTTKWEIKTGSADQPQLYEMTAGHRSTVAEGWGHIQDAREAVAFAVPDFGAEAGTYSFSIDGAGHLTVRWAPARPLGHLELTVYLHFVATPVAVGAVTSPVAMLNPLIVSFTNPK